MRPMLIAMLAFIAGILVFSAPSHAAPGPVLAATAGNVAGGMVQKVDYWHRYYRHTDMRQALLRLFRLFRLFLFPRPPLPSWSPRFWCRSAPPVAANITIGTASNASTRATTILTSDQDSRWLSGSGVAPGF